MNLFAGKVLIVDLTTGQLSKEPLRMDWAREYWGSYGLATRYYWDAVSPDVDPFSAENALVIMPGALTGTIVPMTGRTSMTSKSPLTGTIFNTNVGGAFGPELKFAGYDGIIIKGRAAAPVYLKIVDDEVSLESAEALTGKGIFETEKSLEEAVGTPDARCLAIGPAGEQQVPYAIIGSDAYRQMGRAGGGALFGSKNLKGIVCRGTGAVKVADLQGFWAKASHYKETNLFDELNLWAKTDGTPVLVDVTSEVGVLPVRNFTQGSSERLQSINTDAIKAVKQGERGCASCPQACGKFTRIGDAKVEGPEYEALALAGANCDVYDMESIIRYNSLCDDLGLDIMSCANTVALAMDITESGRGDLGLKFGDVDFFKVVTEIANLSTERGRDLALGAKKLAEKYHATDMSMEVKGLEMPAYDPRGNYGMGVAYATSERGACHLRAFTLFAEDPFDTSTLVEEVQAMQNFNSVKWSLGFCEFWATLDSEILADLLTSALGEEVSADEIDRAGERIWNLNRLFNVKNGFSAKEDSLPEKVLNRKLEKAGPSEGRVFGLEDFEQAKQVYYRMRDWDENGIPSATKIAELGLDAFAS